MKVWVKVYVEVTKGVREGMSKGVRDGMSKGVRGV